MPGWSKQDTTKAIPSKRGNVKFDHNLYNLIGSNLLRSFKEGEVTQGQLDDILHKISFEANADEGKDYGVNLGYNVPSVWYGENEYRIKFTTDYSG